MTQNKIQKERAVVKGMSGIKVITKHEVHAAIPLHKDRQKT